MMAIASKTFVFVSVLSATLAVYFVQPMQPHILELSNSVHDAYTLGHALNNVFSQSLCSDTNHSIHTLSEEVYPNKKIINDNYDIIYREFKDFRDQQGMTRFGDLDPVQRTLFGTHWEVLWLKVYGRSTCLSDHFPKTLELVRQSGLPAKGIMISRLGPGKSLSRHTGATNGVLRYLMAIKTEEGPYMDIWNTKDPYEFVQPKRFYFREGEEVVFDDTFYHSSTNPTDQERIVFWLDLARHDAKGWREWLWTKLVYKAIEILNPPTIRNIVDRTNLHFCPEQNL